VNYTTPRNDEMGNGEVACHRIGDMDIGTCLVCVCCNID